MRRTSTILVMLVLVAACRGPRPARDAASCTHVQATRELRGAPLCEDVWTCARPPGGPWDRVGLRRLAPCEGATGPVVLYLPGMHMNARLPIGDPRHDLRMYLAAAGLRAWGLDYRTHAVPAEASTADLAALSAWSGEVFADDAAWAAGFVRAADSGPLYLAGFSYGAGVAYRLAARRNAGLAGLIILDGAAGGARAGGSGGPAIDVGGSRLPYAERQRLLSDVIEDPEGPSVLPDSPNAGAALADVLFTAPAFGGNGGLSAARLGVSDVQVVARLLAAYDRWWPRAALDADAPGPPKSPVPVLAFATTNMGPAWVERVRASARAFGGESAMVRELRGYGHLDILVGAHAAQVVFEPTRAWLEGETLPPRPSAGSD